MHAAPFGSLSRGHKARRKQLPYRLTFWSPPTLSQRRLVQWAENRLESASFQKVCLAHRAGNSNTKHTWLGRGGGLWGTAVQWDICVFKRTSCVDLHVGTTVSWLLKVEIELGLYIAAKEMWMQIQKHLCSQRSRLFLFLGWGWFYFWFHSPAKEVWGFGQMISLLWAPWIQQKNCVGLQLRFFLAPGFPSLDAPGQGDHETWCNNLGPSQVLAQQMVVPFSQGSPSDALSGLLNAPSCKRVMGGRRKTLTRHTTNSRKWKNFYSRKGALHIAPQCQLGLERKDMEKNTDVHCAKV